MQNVEQYHSPNEGREIINNNFAEIEALAGYSANTYTTGTSITNKTIYFNRNDSLSAYSADLSSMFLWTGGSSGTSSIKAVNGSSIDATGDYAVAIGGGTLASGSYSFALGSGGRATGNGSVSMGRGSLASGAYSYAGGAGSSATTNSSFAHGDNCLANGVTSFALGTSSQALGPNSFAKGSSVMAYGDNSQAEGNSTIASGSSSHAEGSGTIANGNSSHVEGRETKTYGAGSHAEGYLSVASGAYSHAEGSTTANGDYSHAEGSGNTASADFSHASGINTNAYLVGQYAKSSYGSLTNAQYSHVTIGCTTLSTTTPTKLTLHSGNELTIPSDVYWKGRAMIVASSHTQEIAEFDCTFLAKNVGGVSTLVTSGVTAGVDEILLSGLTINVNDTTDSLEFFGLGNASKKINWYGFVEMVEIPQPQ